MADPKRRLATNVAGPFFVDATCIDCDACRWIAPATFDEEDGQSRVHRQPADDAERALAELAAVACPTASIGVAEDAVARAGLLRAVAAFPRPIAPDVENVLHCGFHDAKSYGAASWLIRRAAGNVLVDVPRFTAPLVARLEALGGVALIVLTHEDDVGDHALFAERFQARRVMHRADLDDGTRTIEQPVDGDDDVLLADDLRVIMTPGHTEGSICLLHEQAGQRFLFTGDHVAWDLKRHALQPFTAFNRCGLDVQRESMERLAQHPCEWILPGHGAPVRLPADKMRQQLLACARTLTFAIEE